MARPVSTHETRSVSVRKRHNGDDVREAAGPGPRRSGGLMASTARELPHGPDARPGRGRSAPPPHAPSPRTADCWAGPHARDDVVQRPVDDVPDPGHVGLGDALQAHAEVGVPGVAVVPGAQEKSPGERPAPATRSPSASEEGRPRHGTGPRTTTGHGAVSAASSDARCSDAARAGTTPFNLSGVT